MISRREQLLTVTSVVMPALACLALSLVAISSPRDGGLFARELALLATVLAALATVPIRSGTVDRVDLWAANVLYFVLGGARVLGLGAAVSESAPSEVTFQTLFSVILQLPLMVVGSLSFAWFFAAFLGIVAFAILGALLDRAAPDAVPAIAWGALTIARWAQCERHLESSLPTARSGRLAPWRHPAPRWIAWPLNLLANSRVAQLLLEPMPVPALKSDIGDVLYVNYLVEAERLSPYVPEGLALQRLGPRGRYALFSFLTYRHGHFGAAAMGALRRLAPSPIQTNWRIHVEDPRTGHRGVHFVSTAMDHTAMALAARLFAEATPMHVLRRAALACDEDRAVRLALDPGSGSAPDAEALLAPPGEASSVYRDATWDEPWRACFDDFDALLAYCVPQDRVLDAQPWRARVSRHEIHLDVALGRCTRLVGTVRSNAAKAIVGDAQPLCFLVPGVTLELHDEAYDPLPRG